MRGRYGVCGQSICYHAAAFRDMLKIDMQHDHVLKKLNFDLLTPVKSYKISHLNSSLYFNLLIVFANSLDPHQDNGQGK